MLMEPSRGRYRHLAIMEGPDPENGTGGAMFPKLLRKGTPRPRFNQFGTQQSVDLESDSFLEKKQKLFKCARDKESKSFDQLSSVLGSVSKDDDRKRLVQEKDDRGNTAFHYAAKAGNLDVCKQLHKDGADINAKGQNKMKPLQFAARYGDEKRHKDVWECMQWIMDELEKLKRTRKGSEVKVRRSRSSAKASEKEEVFDVREKDKYDFSLLHHAIQNTNWEETPFVARKLLESKKFKVTEADTQGNTSLHLAAEFDKQKRHKILDVFLEKNENIPPEDLTECIIQKNKQGKTPLHIACGVGNPDSVEQLLKATKRLGINPSSIIDSPDNDGQHPLYLAIESGNLDMMRILMKEGVVVSQDAVNCAVRCVKWFYTFYINAFACRTGSVEALEVLRPSVKESQRNLKQESRFL